MDVDTGTTRVDLHVQLDERPQGIMGRIKYSRDLFDESTIVRLVDHFKILLEGIVTNPDRSISAFPILTANERLGARRPHNLVRPSNPFGRFEAEDIEQSIPRRFETQAAKHPRRPDRTCGVDL